MPENPRSALCMEIQLKMRLSEFDSLSFTLAKFHSSIVANASGCSGNVRDVAISQSFALVPNRNTRLSKTASFPFEVTHSEFLSWSFSCSKLFILESLKRHRIAIKWNIRTFAQLKLARACSDKCRASAGDVHWTLWRLFKWRALKKD